MIKVIGIGLKGADSLNISNLEIINQATVLIGGKRHLDYFPNHSAIKLIIGNLNELISQIREYQNQREKIVILATGDPLFFGIGRLLLVNFANEELEFYPHLSCVQLAFNRLKLSWHDAQFISIHGRDIEPLIKALKQGQNKIAILTDNQNNPFVIWQLCQQLKLPQTYDFWLCENLGCEEEKITKIETKEYLKQNKLARLNIIILLRKSLNFSSKIDLNKLPLIGLDDNLFASFPDRPSLMTKREIRVMILAELALQSQSSPERLPQIIWDIGAGTGSVSIEIARLVKNSKIYAIEKTAIGASLIRQNCGKFKVNNIEIINQEAIKAITDLPSPDRIFLGGSGGNLSAILELINTKIKPEGKLVIALATLENLTESITWLKQNNWNYKILQLQINRSLAIANLTRFTPLNPVQIITTSPDSLSN